MTQTYWIKAATDYTLANSPSGLSHYTPESHENAVWSWKGTPVDVNHQSLNGAEPVGKVETAFYIPEDGLYQKISIEDEDIISLIESDEHNGFSIGSKTKNSDGPSILEYEPNHVSVVVEKEPMCSKEECDVVSAGICISQEDGFRPSPASVNLPDDLELSLLRFLIEDKRFSTEVVFDAIGMVMEHLQTDSEPEIGQIRRRIEESMNQSQFEDFESCVVRFKDGGRSKEEAERACQRIFDNESSEEETLEDFISDSDDKEAAILEAIEKFDIDSEIFENLNLKSTNDGDSPMTECDCDNENLVSAEEFEALSTKVDDLQSTVEEKEMQLSAKDETIDELEREVENLSSEVEDYRQEKREDLISALPESDDIDYSEKSLERLQELHEFHVSTKKETAGATPAGVDNESAKEPEKETSGFKEALQKVRG